MAPESERSELLLLFSLAVGTLGCPVQAELVTYPGPDGIRPSDQYAVQVLQNGHMQDAFVYMVHAQRPQSNRSKTTSWTTFSFSGTVTVRVTKLQGGFDSCRILPSSRRIAPARHGNAVEFALSVPGQFSVEFDDDITHPMLVFADPLETDIPTPDDPNVVYFGPGVHEIGQGYVIKTGQTVYLAGGAYVKGQLVSHEASNVTIRGRGILSGEDLPERGPRLIDIRGWSTRNTLIEGITLVNAPHYNIEMAGAKNVVRNVKMISWHFSTDGVSTGRDGLVEDCFFKVNDDAIKLYWSGMVVRRCVIWQLENGAPFQISWNMPSDNTGFRVSDCDVIRAEHRWNNNNLAIFDAVHAGCGHMSGYVFENIRIENAPWRLFYLTLDRNEYYNPDQGFGNISNITFRNITVDGPEQQKPSTIRGMDEEHQVYDIVFENLRVNGRYITGPEAIRMEIDPRTTHGIRFVVTAPDARQEQGR